MYSFIANLTPTPILPLLLSAVGPGSAARSCVIVGELAGTATGYAFVMHGFACLVRCWRLATS
eukprot:scaffold73634_cov57-Phaeocystis_antarctica.AAC.3